MPAYFVAEIEITNQVGFEPYRAAVPATIAQYDGRYLTRGSNVELREGGPEPKRVVILEFADTAAIKALVRFARVPENTPDPACQLDWPRLHRRRGELTAPRGIFVVGIASAGPSLGAEGRRQWPHGLGQSLHAPGHRPALPEHPFPTRRQSR